MAIVAEFETDLIRLRTKEGMKVARANGRLRGEHPRQEAHLVALMSGEYSTAAIGDLFGVAGSTVYGAVGRIAGSAPPTSATDLGRQAMCPRSTR